MNATKPLGRKAYGSIGHLPGSRTGPGDHQINPGQAKIATEKTRDSKDTVIVQEKLDGSCTAVAMVDGKIIALNRSGYPAWSSPYEQHKMFADWVQRNEGRFRAVLREGERLVGEWCAMAHGTIYDLQEFEPWSAFDLMKGSERTCYNDLVTRLNDEFEMPCLWHVGEAISVSQVLNKAGQFKGKYQCDLDEGVVYRVEREGKVDFLGKYVRPGKEDGKYLPSVTGKEPVWNWKPEWWGA